MRVAVIGAGIVGVTTAYELAADGHEVEVFERRGSVAAETSFANAGLVAPGYVTPWAAPGMPAKVLGHLLSRHAPVRLHPTLNPATLGWLWQWWRACRLETWQANRAAMQKLAFFSRQRLHALTASLKLDYERREGYLVLLRTAKDLALAKPGLTLLTELNMRFRLVDAAQCRRIEPDLNPDTALHAGIHLPDDEVGNCRQFAHLLRTEAQKLGVQFHFHNTVQQIVPGSRPQLTHAYAPPAESTQLIHGPHTPAEEPPATEALPFEAVTQDFDAVVICAAMGAPALLRPLGFKLPLMPVYGYSLTAPLRHHHAHPDHGPRSALMDERYKVAISRLGARVRVAGSAEIGGSLSRMNDAALATLYKVLHDWFPGSASATQAQRWKGARPMLPDGPPIIGRSGRDGVWLNLGHGSSGWALACGSARVLADQLAGRAPPVDTSRFEVERRRR